MPGVNATNWDKALKYVYRKYYTSLFTSNQILLKAMRPDPDPVLEGKKVRFGLHTAGSGAITTDGGTTLPTPSYQEWNEAFINFQHTYATVQVDGPTIARTAGNEAAEERAILFEMARIAKDQMYLKQRRLWVGSEGNLTVCGVADSTTDINVTSARLLRAGDIVDILIASDGSTGNGGRKLRVASVNYASNSIELDSTTPIAVATLGATYTVYWQNARRAWTWGIADIVNATANNNPNKGNYGEISRGATTTWWDSQRVTCSGNTLSMDKIAEGIDIIEQYADSDPDKMLLVTDRVTYRYILNELKNDRRYGGTQRKFEAWGNAIEFDGKAIVKDQHCPLNTVYIFSTEYWVNPMDPTVREGEWIGENDGTGAILKQVTGQDAFQAAWRCYDNFYCEHPAAQCVVHTFVTS